MILVLETAWNHAITKKLANGAETFLKEKGFETKRMKVPGALELPLATKWAWSKLHQSVEPLQGVVACGCVIRGETYHFDIVANESARKLMDLSCELELPVGNAVLTVNNIDQADARTSPGRLGNKGAEAAEAVLEMIKLREKMEVKQ